jgi:ParB family transcriptional regulator, chromosome partitioning protein
MERRLGKGLGALLAADPAPAEPRTELPLSKVRPNPHQPRRSFRPEELAELQESIRLHGVLQPIVVRPAAGGFEIIAGERRYRAAKALGLASIPGVVREAVSDRAMLELALVENLQRADLDPIEKARGFRQLLDQGLTQEQVAEQVGLNRATVANFLRLLELSESVQKVVTEGLLTMGHARALLGLPDRRRQEELCALVVRRGLSVRDVESRVRELQSRPAGERDVRLSPPPPPWVRDLETRIRAHLGAKVQVLNGEGYKGQIVIDYHGREDLDRLIAQLAPRKSV